MSDNRNSKSDSKGKPSSSNDQLGENAGSGRLSRSVEDKGKKCK